METQTSLARENQLTDVVGLRVRHFSEKQGAFDSDASELDQPFGASRITVWAISSSTMIPPRSGSTSGPS
jgi:hypothetical protein